MSLSVSSLSLMSRHFQSFVPEDDGPFAHCYNDERKVNLYFEHWKKVIELKHILKSKDPYYHDHLEGIYPFISPKLLKDKATFKAFLSWISPEFMDMVTKEDFNACTIPKDDFTKIQEATLENGKLEPEYQVDLAKLPRRRTMKHQKDPSKFGQSYAAAYLKVYIGPWGKYKKTASSYLADNKDPDDKLADFLRKSLELYKKLGLSDDETISCIYPGTTSRDCLSRWVEHDRISSTSLNSMFFREFEKTFQFPVMCVLHGNIVMSLVFESFVASLLQLSTLLTLRKSDPKASFSLQACDGSALTRTNAGAYLKYKGKGQSSVSSEYHRLISLAKTIIEDKVSTGEAKSKYAAAKSPKTIAELMEQGSLSQDIAEKSVAVYIARSAESNLAKIFVEEMIATGEADTKLDAATSETVKGRLKQAGVSVERVEKISAVYTDSVHGKNVAKSVATKFVESRKANSLYEATRHDDFTKAVMKEGGLSKKRAEGVAGSYEAFTKPRQKPVTLNEEQTLKMKLANDELKKQRRMQRRAAIEQRKAAERARSHK